MSADKSTQVRASQTLAATGTARQTRKMLEPVTVPCQECDVELAADSPDLRLNLTCDDEALVYCVECWERECGADVG